MMYEYFALTTGHEDRLTSSRSSKRQLCRARDKGMPSVSSRAPYVGKVMSVRKFGQYCPPTLALQPVTDLYETVEQGTS